MSIGKERWSAWRSTESGNEETYFISRYYQDIPGRATEVDHVYATDYKDALARLADIVTTDRKRRQGLKTEEKKALPPHVSKEEG